MRSFFCDRCSYEFDVDIDEEENDSENTMFCPKCNVTLARILPETPDRILLREQRLALLHREELRRFLGLILQTILLFGIGALVEWKLRYGLVQFIYAVWWGCVAGLWTRRITRERSVYSGLFSMIFSCITLGIFYAAVFLIPREIPFKLVSYLWFGIFYLFVSAIPAFLFGFYEKKNEF